MKEKSTKAKRGSIYYGWVQVPFLFLTPFLVYAHYIIALGPSTGPVTKEFGWSRTFYTGAYSLAGIVAAIVTPFLGYSVDWWGPRKTIVMGGFCVFLACLLVALENGAGILWYAGWIFFIAFPVIWAGYPALNKVAAMWFLKRRSMIIGFVTFGGAFVYMMAALHGWLIVSFGWRANWIIIGTMCFVFSAIWSIFVIRDRPEQKGFHIDGVAMTAEEKAKWAESRGRPGPRLDGGAPAAAAQEVSFTWLQAIRSPTMWMLCIAMVIVNMAANIQTTQQVPFLESMGISKVAAGAVLGVMGLCGAPGRLFQGWLMDRFGRGTMRWGYVLAFALQIIGLVCLMFARDITLVWAFVVVFGFGYGMSVTAGVAIIPGYFGRGAFSTIYSITRTVGWVGTTVGPLFAAIVYDMTRSYYLSFTVCAIAVAIGAVIMVFAVPPKAPKAKGATVAAKGSA